MNVRQVTRQRQVTEVLDGEEVEYTDTVVEDVPVIPRIPFNLDSLIRKLVFTAALLMTTVAIIWSTAAIGSMLALLAPQWVAYLVAGSFDLAWAACLAAEYHNRYDAEKVALPRNAGVAALLIAMGAIVWDGHLKNAIVVGVVGAGFSLVSKGVWFIAMQMVAVKLDKGHQALLRKRQQEAGLRQALAQSKRDVIILDDKTARLLNALEARRGTAITVEVDREPVREPDRADQVNRIPVQPVHASDQRELPVDQTVNRAEDQVVDPAGQVRELVDRLRKGEELTKSSVATLLGTSPSTAHRRLTAAKAEFEQGTGQYL